MPGATRPRGRARSGTRPSLRRARARRFSRAPPTHPRPAARLPRQRRDDATPRRGAGRAAVRHAVRDNGNVRRGIAPPGERATAAYEGARERVRRFLGAARRATRSSSRAAPPRRSTWSRTSFGRDHVGAGDEIVVTELEHHANIVPWQMLCAQTRRACCGWRRSTTAGVLDPASAFAALLGPQHADRRAGARVERARHAESGRASSRRSRTARGAVVLVDGAQAVAARAGRRHRRSAATSTRSRGTSCYGPTGIGVLYGRARAARRRCRRGRAAARWCGRSRWDAATVRRARRTASRPGRRRSAAAVGLGAAIAYLEDHDPAAVHGARGRSPRLRRETTLARVPGLRMIGTAPAKIARAFPSSSLGVHAHDVADRARRAKGSPSARASPRAADPPPLRGRRDRARLVRALQHAATTSTADRRPRAPSARSSHP